MYCETKEMQYYVIVIVRGVYKGDSAKDWDLAESIKHTEIIITDRNYSALQALNKTFKRRRKSLRKYFEGDYPNGEDELVYVNGYAKKEWAERFVKSLKESFEEETAVKRTIRFTKLFKKFNTTCW